MTLPCGARIITVDDDGPADFDNIQAAINDANNGDTIIVADGTYTGDLMESGEEEYDWDDNGQLEEKVTSAVTFIYNWDGKLSKAYLDSNNIHLKYDPMGNRVWKNSSVNGERKYIVDIAGRLPVILMELDLDQSESIVKSYIYENSRIIAQRDGGQSASKYFYVNDRLGSVRQVIDMYGSVKRNYTYSPFGQLLESGAASGAPSNPFMFTGQWFDDEISQYYLRARMYDPVLMRFTARDPVRGKFKDPLTLHVYLYCLNEPINRADPSGEEFTLSGLGTSIAWSALMGGLQRGFVQGLTGYGKGIGFDAAGAWTGFKEGLGYGALGGGLAYFSAAGFLWAGMSHEATITTSGSIGGGLSGLVEGLFKKENFYSITERVIVGIGGGGFGGWTRRTGSVPTGVIGGVAGNQGAQVVADLTLWFAGLYDNTFREGWRTADERPW